MSVKWEHYKMIFRYVPGPGVEAINNGEIKPVLPLYFDLSSDPHEDYRSRQKAARGTVAGDSYLWRRKAAGYCSQ